MRNFLFSLLARLLSYLLTIGLVWVYAWINNPEINSETVWFVGNVAALLIVSQEEWNF